MSKPKAVVAATFSDAAQSSNGEAAKASLPAVLTFAATEVPKRTRGDGVPNQFLAAVEELRGTDRALTFVVPGSAEMAENVLLRQAVRRLSEAGASEGVTVRRQIVGSDDGVKVTFWVVPRIVRGEAEAEVSA